MNQYLHLKKFENKHEGETAVLFASGPSLNQYERSLIPEKEFISVGVNALIFNDSIDLDYYFCGDNFEKRYGESHPNRCFGMTQLEKIKSKSSTTTCFCVREVEHDVFGGGKALLFSAEDVDSMPAIPFTITRESGPENFKKDISSGAMYNHSIVFPAAQFLLYVGIKKLYLVGHDQGGKHAFHYTDGDDWNDNQIWNWHEFKIFQEKEYPKVEIVSINPVNLKGLFVDAN